MGKFWQTIKRPLIRFAFQIVEEEVEQKIAEIKDEYIKKAAAGSLDLAANYTGLLTDNNPNDKEQVSEFFKQNTDMHITVGADSLRAAAVQIPKEEIQKRALQAISLAEMVLKEAY
ncbi:hypothetical protein AAG747_15365 [Rapidithrix thailandica]|uniref:Uncharacterized protein n=1 Tax=Rapidithrix thailandica TaxID=413964 RepID=A0AAW9RZS3_9BACT